MNKKKIRIGMIVRFTFLIQSTQCTYRFLFYFIDVKPLNACYHIEYQLKYRMHAKTDHWEYIVKKCDKVFELSYANIASIRFKWICAALRKKTKNDVCNV